MLEELKFKFIKFANKEYYDKLISNVALEVYTKNLDKLQFFKKYSEDFAKDFIIDIDNKIKEFFYNDLKNVNYDNLKKRIHIINKESQESVIKKLIDDNEFETLKNIIVNKDKISRVYEISKEIFLPKFSKEQEEIVNLKSKELLLSKIISLDNTGIVLNEYLKQILGAIDEKVKYKEDYFQKVLNNAENPLFFNKKELENIFNINVSKETILDFINKEENKLYLSKSNHPKMLLVILDYLEIDKFEQYELIKNKIDNEYIIKIFCLNNNLEELLIKEKSLLINDNKSINISDYSNEKTNILIESLIDINNVSNYKTKGALIEKLNEHIPIKLTLEDFDVKYSQVEKYCLKDINESDFNDLIKEKENYIIQKLDDKLRNFG